MDEASVLALSFPKDATTGKLCDYISNLTGKRVLEIMGPRGEMLKKDKNFHFQNPRLIGCRVVVRTFWDRSSIFERSREYSHILDEKKISRETPAH
jgi:hypothetical protein